MLSYMHCTDTVTVYNRYGPEGARRYHRTVIHGAMLDCNRQWKDNRVGVQALSPFLLVIPQGADGKTYLPPVAFGELEDKEDFYTLGNGDKVVRGEGLPVTDEATWLAISPTKLDNVVVVKSVDPKYLGGQIVHIEAGG